MALSLASLFDDYPLISWDNGHRRRRARPLLCNILDTLEDQMDQKVGHVFRRLPAILLDLEDDYENRGVGKKRKLRSDAVTSYEPKSKVQVTTKDNKFKISLDTSSYQPDEISVKVVNDKIAISAKHEAKSKDVYEYSEMYRSFDLPESVDPNTVTSHLSASGQLTVEAPMKAIKDTPSGRTIPVEIESKDQQSGESSKASKDQSSE